MPKTQHKKAQHKVTHRDYKRAQQLRREMPRTERIMWHHLRGLPEELGATFRLQQPIHPYVVDFACMDIKLVIELDGESHDTKQERDKQRDKYLHKLGYITLRFTNADVKDNLDGVMQIIMAKIKELKNIVSVSTIEALPP
jgi:very-short-patch-repair endonuclease